MKRIVFGLGMISGFIFLVAFLSLMLQSSLPPELCTCEPWAWLPYLLPLLASLGIFVGGIVYYLTATGMKERGKALVADALLNCLPDEEAKVIRVLLTGPTTQAEISRKTGLGKVKTHRIIKSLKAKNIVDVKPFGKTRLITLILKTDS